MRAPPVPVPAPRLKAAGAPGGRAGPARSLGEADARRLLIDGFFEEIISRLPGSALADAARNAVAARLTG